MEENQLRELKVIYVIGTLHACLHLTVGVVWESVGMPQGEGPLLSLPYFGGQLALVAVSLLLVFLYLWLGLRREPDVPVHLRRFCLTLSFIISLASLVLMIVMCIRTNDYRKEQNRLAKEAYYGAVFMTIIDIIATIFFIPSYLYLTLCNYRLVKLQEKRIEQQKNTPPTDSQPQDQSPSLETQEAALPQTQRNLQRRSSQDHPINQEPLLIPISDQHLCEEAVPSPPSPPLA